MAVFDPAALRAFVRGQQDAADAARRLRAARGVPDPEQSLEQALGLWSLVPGGFSGERTEREKREIDAVRANWARLRAANWGR